MISLRTFKVPYVFVHDFQCFFQSLLHLKNIEKSFWYKNMALLPRTI